MYCLTVFLIFKEFFFLLNVYVARIYYSLVLRSSTASRVAIFVSFQPFPRRGHDNLRCMSSDESSKFRNIVVTTDYLFTVTHFRVTHEI